ncbi:hypothetical protein, partial [Candidatus Competibacter denitrificans]|uniref:hypothetical protein n=1 Tax=Candidatus Competibacter denitrificans TaxID=1400862 RepID=UPI001A7E1D8A
AAGRRSRPLVPARRPLVFRLAGGLGLAVAPFDLALLAVLILPLLVGPHPFDLGLPAVISRSRCDFSQKSLRLM